MSQSLGTLPASLGRTSTMEPTYWTQRSTQQSTKPRGAQPAPVSEQTAEDPGGAAAPSALANDISSRFGRRLRELRHSRSLTQADMARRFGIDRSFISEIECGRKAISLPMLEVIALGLQVSLSELFQDL